RHPLRDLAGRRPRPARRPARPARRQLSGPAAGPGPGRAQPPRPAAAAPRTNPALGRRAPPTHRRLANGPLRPHPPPRRRAMAGRRPRRAPGPPPPPRRLLAARFLTQCRGHRNRKQLPPLTAEQILAWADAHHRRTATWPQAHAGAIAEDPGETWL